jgi:hypothetical protein
VLKQREGFTPWPQGSHDTASAVMRTIFLQEGILGRIQDFVSLFVLITFSSLQCCEVVQLSTGGIYCVYAARLLHVLLTPLVGWVGVWHDIGDNYMNRDSGHDIRNF